MTINRLPFRINQHELANTFLYWNLVVGTPTLEEKCPAAQQWYIPCSYCGAQAGQRCTYNHDSQLSANGMLTNRVEIIKRLRENLSRGNVIAVAKYLVKATVGALHTQMSSENPRRERALHVSCAADSCLAKPDVHCTASPARSIPMHVSPHQERITSAAAYYDQLSRFQEAPDWRLKPALAGLVSPEPIPAELQPDLAHSLSYWREITCATGSCSAADYAHFVPCRHCGAPSGALCNNELLHPLDAVAPPRSRDLTSIVTKTMYGEVLEAFKELTVLTGIATEARYAISKPRDRHRAIACGWCDVPANIACRWVPQAAAGPHLTNHTDRIARSNIYVSNLAAFINTPEWGAQ